MNVDRLNHQATGGIVKQQSGQPALTAVMGGGSFSQPAPAGGFPPESGGERNPNEQPLPLMYFEGHGVNPFVDADEDRRSTFSLDGDTGSFEMAQRYLDDGWLPPPDSVRVEEWLNALDQGYARESDGLGIRLDGMRSPFGEPGYRLLRVGVASARPTGTRDPVSLIFVLDTSGSMDGDNRIGVAKVLVVGLADRLNAGDRVALVTYGETGRVDFPLASAAEIDGLVSKVAEVTPRGGTHLSEGIRLAYEQAATELEAGRQARIVVISDGVGNIGATGPDTVLAHVEAQAARGAAVTALGVGVSGNYNDVMLEALANRGNGTYHYIRSEKQAGEFLIEHADTVLREVARDARVQVSFNPEAVRKWRLIGYENRAVADDDFRDDTLDFGEPGFARDVTALYELRLEAGAADGDTVAEVFLRWQDSARAEVVEENAGVSVAQISDDSVDAAAELVTAAAAAEFAELLRKSYWAQCGSLDAVSALLAQLESPGDDITLLLEMIDAASLSFEPYCAK